MKRNINIQHLVFNLPPCAKWFQCKRKSAVHVAHQRHLALPTPRNNNRARTNAKAKLIYSILTFSYRFFFSSVGAEYHLPHSIAGTFGSKFKSYPQSDRIICAISPKMHRADRTVWGREGGVKGAAGRSVYVCSATPLLAHAMVELTSERN